MDIEVIKSGGAMVRVGLLRTKDGLLLSPWIHPAMEELLRSWGNEEMLDVGLYGRGWTVPAGDPPMRIWNLTQDPGVMKVGDASFAINRPGRSISEGGVLNLAFLRIVGASEGIGRAFLIKGVYTPEFIQDLGRSIANASARFYSLWMRPINISVTVSIQEMAPGKGTT